MKPPTLVADRIVARLAQCGIELIAGAPGTTELSLLRAADRVGVEYLFAPHDSVAVGIADGLARSSGRFSVANLHSTQGLLNAAGSIRAALRDDVPILILAAVPSTAYDIFEPNHFLHELPEALAAVTKWAWTATNAATVPEALERAILLAQADPPGPTALCVPQNVLETPWEDSHEVAETAAPVAIATVEPAAEMIIAVAQRLAAAEDPLILAGFDSRQHWREVEELATRLGAPVIAESLDRGPQLHGVYCRAEHPYFLGYFSRAEPAIGAALARADALLLVGAKATHARALGSLSPQTTVIELNSVPARLGLRCPIDLGIAGSLGRTLQRLRAELERVEGAATDPDHASRGRRRHQRAGAAAGELQRKRADDLAAIEMSGEPISGAQLARALSEALPNSAVLVDDSQGLGHYLKRHYAFSEGDTLYGSMASHLGWALPASLGVKLGRPEALVVCIVGDGSLLFSMQALVAAATHRIPVLAIVANNRGFVSLQKELATRDSLSETTRRWLSLGDASPGYAELARAAGMAGLAVRDAGALTETLKRAQEIVTFDERPCLVEVGMEEEWQAWSESWHVSDPRFDAG